MASPGRSPESSQGGEGGGHGARHRVRRGTEAAKGKYSGSSAEHLWRRLDSMDFINRGMLFAAVLLLCFFPFLIIVNALAGQTAATGLIRHLGLNQEAAAAVSHLFASSSATSSAVTGSSWLFFVLGGIAAATAIQELLPSGPSDLESRGNERRASPAIVRLPMPGRLCLSGRLGWIRGARRRRTGTALCRRSGRADGLLVVHDVASAGGEDLATLAGPPCGRSAAVVAHRPA